MDRNNLYIKHVKQFSLLVDILNNFFNDKKYTKKKFLTETFCEISFYEVNPSP